MVALNDIEGMEMLWAWGMWEWGGDRWAMVEGDMPSGKNGNSIYVR
jgi:hypothetical protein